MAEAEALVARDDRPIGADQLLARQSSQARRHLRLVRGEHLHGAAVEDLALHRATLEHGSLRVIELVEAGGKECAQGWRNVDIAALRDREHLGQKQRVAPSGRRNPLAQSDRSSRDQLLDGILGERLETMSDRPLRTAVEQLRPRHTDEQDRRPGKERHPLDQVEEGVLAPLDVVEDDDERRLLSKQRAERPRDLL